MHLPFPEQLQFVAEGRKTCRLLAGTFAMSAETTRTVHVGSSVQRQFQEYQVRFRWMENGETKGDFDITTGTMDPRQITQGNQLVMLVVDVAKSSNIVDEYRNFARNRADGETIPIAIFAPNGPNWQYLLERELYYIDPWAQNKKSTQQFYVLIASLIGLMFVSLILAVFMPCLTLFEMPVLGFLWIKYMKKTKGNNVSTSEYFSIAQAWAGNLISDGTISRVMSTALGTTNDSGGRL